ncbi:MAG: hypothetical protein P8R42_24370 [Candidatus Binatia bacterium]|nr:hypothetical protein [Candidatus Binatia bacterium]
MQGSVRASRLTVAVVAMIVAGLLVAWRWEEQRINPTTDDAFVQDDIVGVTAQVSGPIVRTFVTDNQQVKREAPLFEIDPPPLVERQFMTRDALDDARTRHLVRSLPEAEVSFSLGLLDAIVRIAQGTAVTCDVLSRAPRR